jgi:ABC-type cobalamin transport system ATPase subunit
VSNEVSGCIEFLTVIAGRKHKGALLDALSEAGGRLIHAVYGKGSVKSGYLADMLGLVPEENKIVIVCLLSAKKSSAVLDMLVRKFHFDKPNTGIAFTVPVERLDFGGPYHGTCQ